MRQPGRHRPEADGLRQVADSPQGLSASRRSPKGEFRSAQHEGTPVSRLHLHIGQLRLHGVSQAEGQRLAAALQHELQRLAHSQPWPSAPLALPAAQLPPLQRMAGERPETTGRRIAQRIAAQWSPR